MSPSVRSGTAACRASCVWLPVAHSHACATSPPPFTLPSRGVVPTLGQGRAPVLQVPVHHTVLLPGHGLGSPQPPGVQGWHAGHQDRPPDILPCSQCTLGGVWHQLRHLRCSHLCCKRTGCQRCHQGGGVVQLIWAGAVPCAAGQCRWQPDGWCADGGVPTLPSHKPVQCVQGAGGGSTR